MGVCRGGRQGLTFSDGVFYDPADGLFKIWYLSVNATLYADLSRRGSLDKA